MIDVIGKAHISTMDIVGYDNRLKSMTIHAVEWGRKPRNSNGLKRPNG